MVAVVIQLLAEPGASIRGVAAQVGCSKSTVERIKEGRHLARVPSTSRLEPGENVLHEPRRCPEGHLCDVWPCRTCAQQAYARATLARLAAIERGLEERRLNPRRQRGPFSGLPDDPRQLEFELTDDENHRRAEVRAQAARERRAPPDKPPASAA